MRKNHSIILSLFFIINIASLIIFSGCGDDPVTNSEPEVYNLIAPDSLILGFPDTTLLFIDVRDPQGLDNIDSVYFTSTKPDGSSSGYRNYMHDDGIDGDSISDDGTYTIGIWSSVQNDSGSYVFHFTVQDKDNNQGNIIDHTLRLFDYRNPVITKIYANQFDDAREHIFVWAKVLDVDGWTNIDSVWVEIAYLEDSSSVGSFKLYDSGNDGDSTANDNVFSRDIAADRDSYFYSGIYQLEFKAIDNNSNLAIPVDTTIEIYPPVTF